MLLSATRHPALDILDFPAGDPWNQPGLQDRRRLLEKSPQSLAFMVLGQEQTEDAEANLPSEEEDAKSDPEPQFFGELGEKERKRRVAHWLGLLESDLGIKVIRDLPDAENTGSEATMASSRTALCPGGGSDGDTISSHEFGVEAAADEDSEATGEDEELIPDDQGKPCFFHKALRQKMRKVTGDMKGMLPDHSQHKLVEESSVFFESTPLAAKRRVRRAGPWRVVEILTLTMAVGMAACSRHWEVGEPISAPGFDLSLPADQVKTHEYLERFDPDFVMITWPSPCWEDTPQPTERDAQFYERQGRQRVHQRRLLGWIQETVFQLRRRGVAVIGEHPWHSAAWQEPIVVDTWAGLAAGRAEMCAYGLRRPDHEWGTGRGLHLRRPLRVVGTKEIVAGVCRLCPGGHRHAPCLGGGFVFKASGVLSVISRAAILQTSPGRL